VHATTCILMHRSPKQWWSAEKTIFQCKWTMSKCTTLNSWDHTSQQMEIAQKKRRIALARQKAIVLASIWKDRNITRSSADADNALDAFSRQLRSTNMVPFRMLHIVSYCAIVTLSLRRLCFYDIRLQKIS